MKLISSKSPDFLKIGAPAERALPTVEIKTLKSMASYCEADIADLHGVGPKALGILKKTLQVRGLPSKK